MTRSFRLPLLAVRVPLSAVGVRTLAAVSLLASAGLVALLAAAELPTGREHLASPLALALSALAIVATVPALLDGRLRFPLAGIASLCLGLVAAVTIGLGASALAIAVGWAVVVAGAATGAYHLLGAEPRDRG
ncbi:hypothetical protein [Agrococcus jenensis]|uniref:Uncharacterized protein n=1 Tax=Agrococcus jenensis TaxID=46353 RepID=A0A3N2AT01_9MICO|nr:hypothetical protein [Agrococcus jenensis]ROR66045.1 hypothetical protein EDD26_1420 [Agrococcus jenensis]